MLINQERRKLHNERVGKKSKTFKMKKINPFLAFIIIIASLTLSSCATVFTGTKDRISFKTSPPGATVLKDGIEVCKTPCSAPIKRSLNNTEIEFKLDGYDTRLITLDKEFNIISVINLGNLLGSGVDALSGAVMKYDRRSYDIELVKNNKTSMIIPGNSSATDMTIVPIKITDSLTIKSISTQSVSTVVVKSKE